MTNKFGLGKWGKIGKGGCLTEMFVYIHSVIIYMLLYNLICVVNVKVVTHQMRCNKCICHVSIYNVRMHIVAEYCHSMPGAVPQN